MQSLRTCLLIFSSLALLAAPAAQAGEPPVQKQTVQKSAVQKQAAQKPAAQQPTVCLAYPRPQDELWHISSRQICYSDVHSKSGATQKKSTQQLAFTRFANDEWYTATLADYIASETKSTRTIIWVHGFWTDPCEAYVRADSVFRNLVNKQANAAPLRLVIWSWPSTRNRRARISQDARDKACRSDLEGVLLARFINQSKTERPLSIVSYSLGTRAMFAALHMLGGGQVDGDRVDATPIVRKIPIRAVTMAAALHNNWLDQNQRFSLALDRAEYTSLLNNDCDRTLSWYPAAFGRNRRRGPQALGDTGLVASDLAPNVRHKFEQFDVCCYVGRRHQVSDYVSFTDLIEKMQHGVFGE
jgi:esterase/lipase superfamily enzyme